LTTFSTFGIAKFREHENKMRENENNLFENENENIKFDLETKLVSRT